MHLDVLELSLSRCVRLREAPYKTLSHSLMIPKEYMSAAGVILPATSSSTGMCVTVPKRLVLRWLCTQQNEQQTLLLLLSHCYFPLSHPAIHLCSMVQAADTDK
jgi:hypothetical protein